MTVSLHCCWFQHMPPFVHTEPEPGAGSPSIGAISQGVALAPPHGTSVGNGRGGRLCPGESSASAALPSSPACACRTDSRSPPLAMPQSASSQYSWLMAIALGVVRICSAVALAVPPPGPPGARQRDPQG